MTDRGLHISRADIRRIEAAAQDCLPRECCGLLLGAQSDGQWRVSQIEQSRNVAADDRNDRFEIDPALLLRTQKAARAGGPRMIGVYHSHPDGDAAPSRTDLESSWQTGMIWLITSVNGAETVTRAFLRDETNFVPVPLQIMEIEP